MIEFCRYVLAAIVAQTHLWPLGMRMNWAGTVSVFAFYTLSGYLMTRVLNERYGFAIRGTVAFACNRVLRLWPAYLALLGMAVVALRFLPLADFHSLIRTPIGPTEIATNLLIIGQVTFDFEQWATLAKPLVTSWSLSIEVCCYLLLALYFASSAARLWALVVLGVVAMALSTGWCAMGGQSTSYGYGPYCFQNRYGVIQAGFVPFAFGGLYYFYRNTLSSWLREHRWLCVFSLAVAIGATSRSAPLIWTIGPFLGIPLMWTILANAREARPTFSQDFFGRASYHLFIAHMPLGAILVTGLDLPKDTVAVYLGTLVIALALSVLLVPMEHRVNALRQKIASAAQ